MMLILKMKAFGDFEVSYDIDVAIGDEQRLQNVCETLNSFCKLLPGCSQDTKLSQYLNNKKYADELTHTLIDAKLFNTHQAQRFVDKLRDMCEHNWVYVYPNTFSLVSVMQI